MGVMGLNNGDELNKEYFTFPCRICHFCQLLLNILNIGFSVLRSHRE